MVRPQPVIRKAEARIARRVSRTRTRPLPKRWPLALSLIGAVAASLVLWAGIFFLIDLVGDLLRAWAT
jgi:hypothetical protein